jgi:hypothetical protein
MEFFDFSNPAFDTLAVAAVALLVVILAVLTMRAVALRDRAMMVSRAGQQEDARRAAYEQRWRNGGMRSA